MYSIDYWGGAVNGCENENLKYNKKIRCLPFMGKEKLKEYYQASDVFVMPTRYDIWGLVVGEAMANGLPVITTDRCLAGIQMVKEEKNGYIVPTEDPEMLSEKMLSIMHKDTYKMGAVSLREMQNYSIESSAKNDIEFIKNLSENY